MILLVDNSSCFRGFGCLEISVLRPGLPFDLGFVLWFGWMDLVDLALVWICGVGLVSLIRFWLLGLRWVFISGWSALGDLLAELVCYLIVDVCVLWFVAICCWWWLDVF